MASSSSSSNSNSRWTYDVFLSFRGEDTRKSFTDHLYAALVRAGINTFRDDDELKRGEEIGSELRKVIRESRFSIIVLSKNYASSTWCLDELEHILACRRKLGHTVWPIFYDTDPSDVRKQKKSFEEAFRRHEDRFKDDMDKVTRWRAALRKVAELKGLDLRKEADGHESKNIDNIVKEISDRLHRKRKLTVAIHSVGLRYRAKKVISMLCDNTLDVCIVGIYGIGGVGKTTIAKEVYNSISHKFDASCFLANVRENSDPKGMIQLQRQLLSETLMGKHEEIYNVDVGLKVIEERLCCKRVLIVLDDVDHKLNQLNRILGDCSWLFPGSRVIITTRIKDLLITSRLYKQYEVQELGHNDSLRLLSLHAFDRVDPIEGYMECAQSVVRYAGGIPLVLEVLGSSLSGEPINVWDITLEKLKVIPKEEIHTSLKISYDSLDDVEKSLFLDIACFFVGFDKDCAMSILDGCGFFPIAGIKKLMKRCLIRIDFGNKLTMHDLLRDMGREIVRQESPEEPENRSRLWRHEDAFNVLTTKLGTKKIQVLILDLPGHSEIILSTKAFKKMNWLRLLQLNYVCTTGSFEKFPRMLRWLRWHGFPLGSIPADLHLENLVSLDMQYSKLYQFQGDVMYLGKLKFLDLSHSHVLTKISNFEGFPNLEILSLDDCTSLVELHDSIGVLMQLHSLTLQNCKSLRSLPGSIYKLRSLKNLNLSYNSIPKAIRNLENHESLPLHEFALTASPRKGPRIMSTLPPSLKKLNLSYCNLSDDMIPHDLSGLNSIQCLELCGNNFSRLPASIVSLPKLCKLGLSMCKSLQSLPELPSSLKKLEAYACLSLESINLVKFRADGNLNLTNCSKLKVAEGYFNLEPSGVEIVEKLLGACGLFTPEPIAGVHMHMFNRLTETISISHLQALSEGGIYSIFLPSSEIPSWFSYQSEGNKISLHVPPLEQGCKIIGFITCAVYASSFSYNSVYASSFSSNSISVTNETKKYRLLYQPSVCLRKVIRNAMWLSYWAFENMNEMIYPLFDKSWRFQDVMEEGDQVNVSADPGVQRCGIYWLYGHNDQDSQSNDLAMISSVSSRHIKSSTFSYDGKKKRIPTFEWDCSGSWSQFWIPILSDAYEEESIRVDDKEDSLSVYDEEESLSASNEEESLSTYDEEGEPECMTEREECIFSRI